MSEAPKSFAVETVSPTLKKISGTIPWETVKAKFDETYRELAKNVSLKGFRKGKVPRSLLKRMFKKHIEQDLTSELIREASVEGLKDHPEPIKAVDTPNEWKVEGGELVEGQPYSYTVEVEVIPDVEIKDFKGIELKKLKVPVKDEDVDHQLEHLREHLTKEVPVEEGNLEPGHTLSMSIMGKIEGSPVSFENQKIVVPEGDDFDKGSVPQAVAAELRGRAVSELEDEVELELTFGEDAKDHAGKSGSFFVELMGVTTKAVPELDDDLAKESGEAETLEELKEQFREKLAKQNEERADDLMEKDLMTELMKRNPFEVGDSLITRQAEMKIDQTLMQLGFPMEGHDFGDYKKNLIDSYRDNAEQEIRRNLILDSLANAQGIEVTDEDVESKLQEIAEQSKESIERIKAEYQKENRLETIKYVLRLTKTLDFLKSESKIVEEEVDAFPEPPKPEVPQEASEDEEGSE